LPSVDGVILFSDRHLIPWASVSTCTNQPRFSKHAARALARSICSGYLFFSSLTADGVVETDGVQEQDPLIINVNFAYQRI